MNLVKLYFIFFCIIFSLRVAFKWQDTTFMAETPAIVMNSPLPEGGFAKVNNDHIVFTGAAEVNWSRISNIRLYLTNESADWNAVYKMPSSNLAWSNTVILKEGSNEIRPYTAALNGKTNWGNTVILEYILGFVSNEFPKPGNIQPEDLNTEQGVNPNIVLYLIIIVIDVIGLIGIFGYAWKKEILAPIFWKLFLPVFTALELFVFITTALRGGLGTILFSLSFLIPAPVSIYLYAYKYRWVEWKQRKEKSA